MQWCYSCMRQINDDMAVCPYCKKMLEHDIPAEHLLPGTVLHDKFMVGYALGQGGFGITYIGYDTMLDMRVAVKEYFPSGYASRTNMSNPAVSCGTSGGERHDIFTAGKEKFLKEARTMARFSGQPGIVDVRDFFEENNTAYIVMEYLQGETLKSYLKRVGTMTMDDTLALLSPVFQSLKKVHAQGIIHRDISPDNIMIIGDQVKLLDFGAARDASMTGNRSLSVVLKQGYAPEEQYRSKGEQGPWTDVYALSATIYKCITGIVPDESTQRLYQDDLKAPSELGAVISETQERALLRGLAIYRSGRFENVEALLDGLNGTGTDDYDGSAPTVLLNVGSAPVAEPRTGGMDQADRQAAAHTDTNTDASPSHSISRRQSGPERRRKKKILLAVAISAILLIGIVAGTVFGMSRLRGGKKLPEDSRNNEAAEEVINPSQQNTNAASAAASASEPVNRGTSSYGGADISGHTGDVSAEPVKEEAITPGVTQEETPTAGTAGEPVNGDTSTKTTPEQNTTPAATPSPEPTATPSPEPTATPSPEPTATPSPEPTATPTPEPTATPTPEPTATPSPEPTATPSPEPTATPSPEPTATPSPTPTASPAGDYSTLDAALKSASDRDLIGLKEEDGKQYITFGKYDMGWYDYDAWKPVHGDGSMETIMWEVLDYDRDKQSALVLCKNIVDLMPYNEEYIAITWEDCTLRKWLNEEFYKTTFTSAERKLIASVKISNPDNWGTEGGNPTKDKIFLLSIDEAEKYYASDAERIRRTCAGDEGWWWLRSPGSGRYFAACVRSGGSVQGCGSLVIDDSLIGVCPAFWINLNP